MAEWVKHQVDVRLTGRITQIPDSQKVFGALVHLYAEYTSSDQATALVTAIKESSKGFMLSNLLPKGISLYLTTIYLISCLAKIKSLIRSIIRHLRSVCLPLWNRLN